MECGTKVRHATREDALAHLKDLVWINYARKQTERSKGLTTYPCSQCGQWHVGHEPSAPLVYHYTTVNRLDSILADGMLKPGKPRLLSRKTTRKVWRKAGLTPAERLQAVRDASEPAPLLWFSRNAIWERSVNKGVLNWTTASGEPRESRGRRWTELAGGGLIRFGCPAYVAKLRWSDYLALNPTSKGLRDAMAQCGDPTEWLATDEPVVVTKIKTTEVYCDERWQTLDEAADRFDAYIEARPLVYTRAERTLVDKTVAWLYAWTPDQTEASLVATLTEPERILFEDEPGPVRRALARLRQEAC